MGLRSRGEKPYTGIRFVWANEKLWQNDSLWKRHLNGSSNIICTSTCDNTVFMTLIVFSFFIFFLEKKEDQFFATISAFFIYTQFTNQVIFSIFFTIYSDKSSSVFIRYLHVIIFLFLLLIVLHEVMFICIDFLFCIYYTCLYKSPSNETLYQ